MMWLEIPRFVELRMVTAFDQSRVQINIDDVLIQGGLSDEDLGEVVAIQLAVPITSLFGAHPRAK